MGRQHFFTFLLLAGSSSQQAKWQRNLCFQSCPPGSGLILLSRTFPGLAQKCISLGFPTSLWSSCVATDAPVEAYFMWTDRVCVCRLVLIKKVGCSIRGAASLCGPAAGHIAWHYTLRFRGVARPHGESPEGCHYKGSTHTHTHTHMQNSRKTQLMDATCKYLLSLHIICIDVFMFYTLRSH